MSHLFVPKAPFQDWGEFPFDGSNLSQLLAALIMVASIASLVAVVSVSLISILVGEPLRPVRRRNSVPTDAVGICARAGVDCVDK